MRLPYRNPELPVDASHERFTADHNRCILCTRCVRVCAEVEGAHVWDVMGRGANSRVITDMAQPWGEATSCTSCGKCIQVCPTGALFDKQASAGGMVFDGGTLEHAQQIAVHQSPRTTKLYDRTKDEISLDEVELIKF